MKLSTNLFSAQEMGRKAFEALVKLYFAPSDQRRIMLAYRLSKYGHYKQTRDNGGRYFEHPKAVTVMLLLLCIFDADVIIATLLHDVLEDSFILTDEDVEVLFGKRVYHILNMVTKRPGLSLEIYYERLTGDGPASWLVKCGDRVHNLSTLPDGKEGDEEDIKRCKARKLKQVNETRIKILPLARALAASPGYEIVGNWFVGQLTDWCNKREQEATAS